MSVSVIKSHVKIGIEKAKELGLPQAVSRYNWPSIMETGLIAYFYVQALKLENKARSNTCLITHTQKVNL